MWLARLRHGVLRVATDAGRRYVAPCLWERVALLWMFRNFTVLPQQVLTAGQQELVQNICARGSLPSPDRIEADAVLGTIEISSPLPKKPPAAQRPPMRAMARIARSG